VRFIWKKASNRRFSADQRALRSKTGVQAKEGSAESCVAARGAIIQNGAIPICACHKTFGSIQTENSQIAL